MLSDKYHSLLEFGRGLSISDLNAREEGGKLKLTGNAAYQLDKDLENIPNADLPTRDRAHLQDRATDRGAGEIRARF